MQWVWILSFTVLGGQPEHGQQAKYESKQACEQALLDLRQRESLRGRELVGRCWFGQTGGKGWW